MSSSNGSTVGVTWAVASLVVVGTILGGSPAWGQSPPPELNENCIVSVLNRNTRVRPDGTWVLPNIPANFGLVRARATCIFDGVTVSGESAPFAIAANASIDVPPIVLGPTTPIPRTLAVTPSPSQLGQVGATAQVTVIATYADGTTRNVTAGTTGTKYVASNPALASVTADGVVTALASGTVLVQATHEGTSGFTSVRVVLSADSDGDGIPDDVELELGMNPNDPADALEDFDGDGLSNLEEYLLGTQIRNPDTDGDGLSDGAEVRQHFTNPLLFDTDGDGVWDGLEIATGSDPNDAASYNLAAVLKEITVAPSTFVLTVNAIVLEAYQQLTVTGLMIDGHTLNLTSTTRGTNYASSDLNVCNFGSPDGRVFAGQNGTCTITVTNAGFSAAATGTVTSFTPTALGFVAVPGFANNVDVSGNHAYVAAGATGLQVVDITNRSAPVVIGSRDTPGNANDVKVAGTLAYVADGASGLQIIDVSNPAAPAIVGTFDTPGDAWDVVVRGTTAYVADGVLGLRILDVSNPASPRLLGAIDPAGTQKGVDVDPVRQIAVLASGTSGIHVIDVSNPAAPVQIGAVSTGGDARDVVLKGLFAYVADFSRSFTVVDVSTPSGPVVRASTPQATGGLLNDVTAQNDFALGADVFFVNGVPVINVSTPANPIPRAILNFPGDFDGQGIAADGSYVYLAAVAGSAFIENGANGTSRLFVGQYLALEDRNGVPPTVAITAPAAGTTFIEGGPIPIRVEATDDVAVAGVTFLVDGQVVFTDTSYPYEITATAPSGVSSAVLGASAADLGGNVGVAETITVNVEPDPLTTVTGLVVDVASQPVGGALVTVFNTFTATTAADGTFSIFGVPTTRGPIVAQATITVDGVALRGSSGSFEPVPAGQTNVGQIVVRSARKVAIFGAPSTTTWNADVRSKIEGTGLFTQVDAFLVTAGQPVPTLAQLQEYDAVLVYSDTGFNNNVALGDVLANYMDAGGGVVLATFAFWDSQPLSIQGRIKTAGYLPFTTASQAQPGNLTLVPIEPAHPILSGVTSFHGGTASYHNSSIGITAGATRVANWSNGQPLIATKIPTAGFIVGLNFYPPSSTARSDFWQANTGGALIMGNALVWAAR